jgi:hypothetical protein
MNYDDFIAIASQLTPNPIISSTLPTQVEWDSYSSTLQKKMFDSVRLFLSIEQGT